MAETSSTSTSSGARSGPLASPHPVAWSLWRDGPAQATRQNAGPEGSPLKNGAGGELQGFSELGPRHQGPKEATPGPGGYPGGDPTAQGQSQERPPDTHLLRRVDGSAIEGLFPEYLSLCFQSYSGRWNKHKNRIPRKRDTRRTKTTFQKQNQLFR